MKRRPMETPGAKLSRRARAWRTLAGKSADQSREARMGFLFRRLIRIIKQKRRMRRGR